MFFVKIPTKPSSGAGEPLALTCFGCFSSKSPENRHPERSASQIYRVTQRLWRGVEGPRRCLSYPCCSELFNHRNPHRAAPAVFLLGREPRPWKIITVHEVSPGGNTLAAGPAHNHRQRPHQDLDAQPDTPVLDVSSIQGNIAVERRVLPRLHLPQPGHAG